MAKNKNNRSESLTNNATNKTTDRTLSKIRTHSEDGRLVVLFCKHKCLKERADISGWIRDFNEQHNTSELEGLTGFHFHFYRQPFPFYGVEAQLNSKLYALIYVVANRNFSYNHHDITKAKFLDWLSELENAAIVRPANYRELDSWLGKSREYCDSLLQEQKFVVLVHHLSQCRDYLLENIARSFHNDSNVTVIEVARPLTTEAEVVLSWRLGGLSQQCRMIIVVHNNAFIEVNNDITPAQLHPFVKNWTNAGNCTFGVPRTVNVTLNEIQLQYLSEELLIKNIETNRVFILVGTIGGIAVVALAISIFWGLNGTSFVNKN
ncbi:putative potassium channel regulatory protein sup-10 [Ditylenchus destructor]|nr:putative potassium channel regulatory protein sup-10 [Ditylenchus destructor]